MSATAAAAFTLGINSLEYFMRERLRPPGTLACVRVGVYIRNLRRIIRSFKLPTEIRPHHFYRDDPLYSQERQEYTPGLTPRIS